MGVNKFYDIDLPFGEVFERKLRYMFGNKKFEVKTERDIWKTTGNICIELKYKNGESGLETTKADYWCQVFTDNMQIEFIVIFPVQKLRERVKDLVRNGQAELKYGGDNNDSLIALLPRSILLDPHPPISCGTSKTVGVENDNS